MVKVSYVGICGSDLHYYRYGQNGSFKIIQPLIPGHEFSGIVLNDPSGEFPEGLPVTCHPATFGQPDMALLDAPHLWQGGSYMGSAAALPHRNGAAAEVVAVAHERIFPLPPDLAPKTAALSEPLAVALHAIHLAGNFTSLKSGSRIAVSGCGPIGLLLLRSLRNIYDVQPYAIDPKGFARDQARLLGAFTAISPTEFGDRNNEFDLVFECSGSPQALSTAVLAARPRGHIVQVGMLPAGDSGIDLSPATAKELSISFSFRCFNEFLQAIKLLNSDPLYATIITHEYPASQAALAFEAALKVDRASKVVITF